MPPRSGAGRQEQSEGRSALGRRAAGSRCAAQCPLSGGGGEGGKDPSDGENSTEALQGSGSSLELSPRCTSSACPWQAATAALCHLQLLLLPSPQQRFLDIPVFSFTKLSWSPPSPGAVVQVWLGAAARWQQLLLPRKVHAGPQQPPPASATTCCSTPSPSWPARSGHARPEGCLPPCSRKSSPPRSHPSPAARPARRGRPQPGPSWDLGCPG